MYNFCLCILLYDVLRVCFLVLEAFLKVNDTIVIGKNNYTVCYPVAAMVFVFLYVKLFFFVLFGLCGDTRGI